MSEDQEREIVIPESHAAQRLDKALGDLCGSLSRSNIQNLIHEGVILLNGSPVKNVKYKTQAGDVVKLPELSEEKGPQAEDLSLDILYEDDDVLVINKGVGLVVHPGAGQKDGTLVNALIHRYGDGFREIGDPERPGIVHRLDKDTSGAMLVAKSQRAYKSLVGQLADREVGRIYHALVWGVPDLVKGKIDQPLKRHHAYRQKMVINEEGREAITEYKVIESYEEAISLLECKLHTGRTHQIRVHCQALGHPVLGDPIYGIQQTKAQSYLRRNDFPEEIQKAVLAFSRQALHASNIDFCHPVSEVQENFSVPYPADFKRIISFLEQL